MAKRAAERVVRTGTVLSVAGGRAQLRVGGDAGVAPGDACPGCSCGHGSRLQDIAALDGIGVQPGESVLVEISSNRALHAGTVLFAVPLLGMVAGAVVGEHFGLFPVGLGLGTALGAIPLLWVRHLFSPERGSVRIIDRLNAAAD